MRTAAFPLHRHSLPQLAIDGVLVALAYYLSYRLRFDADLPAQYHDLLSATIIWVVAIALVVFTLFRLYQRWWRYTRQRDFVSIVQAVAVVTLGIAGYVALVKPVTRPGGAAGEIAVTLPTGVLGSFFLLTLVLVGGARWIAHAIYERPSEASAPAGTPAAS